MTAGAGERGLALADRMDVESVLTRRHSFSDILSNTPCGVWTSCTVPTSLPEASLRAAFAVGLWACAENETATPAAAMRVHIIGAIRIVLSFRDGRPALPYSRTFGGR